MKASMGKYVRIALSNVETAKILTGAVIKAMSISDSFKIKGVLPDGKILILRRVKLD